MPRAGFEPVIPMFERPKTVLALDRSAIETGYLIKLKRKMLKIFWLENLNEREYSEDKGVVGRIILERSQGYGWEVVDWMHLV
jgi:hypothetical protein